MFCNVYGNASLVDHVAKMITNDVLYIKESSVEAFLRLATDLEPRSTIEAVLYFLDARKAYEFPLYESFKYIFRCTIVRGLNRMFRSIQLEPRRKMFFGLSVNIGTDNAR